MLHILQDTRRFRALPKLKWLMFIHIFEIHWLTSAVNKEKNARFYHTYIDEDSMRWAKGPLDFALIFCFIQDGT